MADSDGLRRRGAPTASANTDAADGMRQVDTDYRSSESDGDGKGESKGDRNDRNEGGDGDAMYCLGVWYGHGIKGLAKNLVQARAWYERSAAARDPRGMGSFGEFLLIGFGGSKETSLGLVNVTDAAHLGSEVGAYGLGKAFFKGTSGLSKDPARARYWLKKIADGECAHKHLNNKAKATAAEWLRALDD